MTRDGAAVTDEWLDVSTCGTDGDASAAQRSLSVCTAGTACPDLNMNPQPQLGAAMTSLRH